MVRLLDIMGLRFIPAQAYYDLRGKIVADDWSKSITAYLESNDAARMRGTVASTGSRSSVSTRSAHLRSR